MAIGEVLRAWLPAGGLGEVLYAYPSLDSTNDLAARLAGQEAAMGTVVFADHQRRGRGRGGSLWHTPAGSAIALSVILRPTAAHPLRWAGAGALAVADALRLEGLSPQIKWPNDVLLGGKKAAGVLAEAAWYGHQPAYVVLGLGVNVGRASVPRGEVAFPATSVEEQVGREVSRWSLIAEIVRALESRWEQTASPAFLEAWEAHLAYRGGRVRVEIGTEVVEGRLMGLGPEGQARILRDDGQVAWCGGEAQVLRPVDTPPE